MGLSSISNHGYLIGVIFFLLVQSQFWTFSNGLHCFSCWKFHCEEPSDSCKEMKHLPFANNQTREVSANWRESPECPSNSEDMHLSRKYVQNCSEHQTACGSYFIKVTAAIAKNSLDEPEYPILVTPNYYYSTIVALGCITVAESTETGPIVTVKTTLSTTSKVNTTVTTAMSTTTSSPSTSKLSESTTEVTKKITETVTKPNINNSTTSSETKLGQDATTMIGSDDIKKTPDENSDGKKTTSSTTTTGHVTSSSAAPAEIVDVAPPVPLPSSIAHHHEKEDDKSSEDDSPSEHSHDEYKVVPLASSNLKTRRCPMEFAHVENRTSYGTLERINMTGVFAVCSQCELPLCNSAYPQDDSAFIAASSSSSSPSSSSSSSSPSTSSSSSSSSASSNSSSPSSTASTSAPAQSTTPYNSSSSSFNSKSNFCGVSLASTVVAGLLALTHVLDFGS